MRLNGDQIKTKDSCHSDSSCGKKVSEEISTMSQTVFSLLRNQILKSKDRDINMNSKISYPIDPRPNIHYKA